MVSPKDIEFESDIQEKISIEDIRAEYNDGVIIWLNGSGPSPNRKLGSYRCVLDYNGHIKFMETEIVGATSNKTMIIGAIDAIKCISKSI